MPISRRDFIKQIIIPSLAGLGMTSIPVFALGQSSDRLLIVGAQNYVCFIDLVNFTVKKINVGFPPHSFLKHNQRPTRFVAIEKWGAHAAVVDFDRGEQKTISSGDGYLFYGHGIQDSVLNAVFITRVDTKTGLGHLIGYDPKDFKPIIDFQVTPGGLHDCHALSNGTAILASSGIRKDTYAIPQKGIRIALSSLVHIDMKDNGRILRELKIDDPQQILAHFAVTHDGAILALSGPFGASQDVHGKLYYSPDGVSPLRSLEWEPEVDKELKDEMLSIALNKDHTRAAVTNPVSGIISLVDMKNGTILKTKHEPFHSIAYDQTNDEFLGAYNGLERIDNHFSKQATVSLKSNEIFDGAHCLLSTIST